MGLLASTGKIPKDAGRRRMFGILDTAEQTKCATDGTFSSNPHVVLILTVGRLNRSINRTVSSRDSNGYATIPIAVPKLGGDHCGNRQSRKLTSCGSEILDFTEATVL